MTVRSLKVIRQVSPRAPLRAPAPRISRFRLRTVDLGGPDGIAGPVAYADFGGPSAGAPTLVLVHGLGGNHLNWLPAAPMLSKHARVLAVDLVGFGRTPAAGRGHDLETQRRTLERFVAEVVREPAVLVGNSMGGLVTLMTAAHAPAHVSGLILVSPAMPPVDLRAGDLPMVARQLLHVTPGIGELAMWTAGRRAGARGLFLDLLTLGTKDVRRVPPEVVEANVSAIADRMERMPLRYVESYLDATRSMVAHLARRSQLRASIRAVQAKTLILHGEADRLVPHACSRALVSERPDFELEVLDDVGHVPQMEDAPRFVDRVASWLDRTGLRPRVEHEEIEPAPSSRAA